MTRKPNGKLILNPSFNHRPQARLKLEPIQENEPVENDTRIVPDSESDSLAKESLREDIQDQLNEELWDELRTTKRRKASFSDKTAPISQVGSSISLEKEIEQEEQVWDHHSNTLATLPSYLGHQDDKSEIIPIPLHQTLRL